MGKEEKDIALLEQYAMGHVEYDVLKMALESSDTYANTEEAVTLFNKALQSLELAYWRQELKKIGEEQSRIQRPLH